LYVKAGTKVANLIDGGGQENNKRGGTENTAYIAGFAAAVEKAAANVGKMQEVKKLRDKLIDGILKIPYTRINGDLEKRLPGNVNATFEFIEGESLLLWLDMNGIYVSTGSACSSASLEPSHVLLAIGVPVEIAHGSLRFTFGTDNTDEDVDIILEKLPGIVEKLRAMSPLYEGVR
jgi:cysteine desulfurase